MITLKEKAIIALIISFTVVASLTVSFRILEIASNKFIEDKVKEECLK